MSYYEDQEDAWMENDCKGSPDQYNPHDPDSWPKHHSAAALSMMPKRTKSQKRNAQRKRAKQRKLAASKTEATA